MVEHKGHDHIIIKRTKGNHTRPKNGMTGQDKGGKARLAGIFLFLITNSSKGCRRDEMDGTIRDRNKFITEIIWVGGGKIYAIPEHNTCKWCLELYVPGHHSAGTEMTPNTKEQAC